MACVLRLKLRTLENFGGERVLPATANDLLQPSGGESGGHTPVRAPLWDHIENFLFHYCI